MGQETVGFIGLGLMGHGMAKNIVEKGYPLVVAGRRNRKPIDDLVARGAVEAKTAREVGAAIILRGLRAVADYEFEFQITAMNQQLDREIETVFLMADPRHQAIASKLVKEIATMGGDVTPFVPAGVRRRLMEKVAQRA